MRIERIWLRTVGMDTKDWTQISRALAPLIKADRTSSSLRVSRSNSRSCLLITKTRPFQAAGAPRSVTHAETRHSVPDRFRFTPPLAQATNYGLEISTSRCVDFRVEEALLGWLNRPATVSEPTTPVHCVLAIKRYSLRQAQEQDSRLAGRPVSIGEPLIFRARKAPQP
jgi:hypothetical protein